MVGIIGSLISKSVFTDLLELILVLGSVLTLYWIPVQIFRSIPMGRSGAETAITQTTRLRNKDSRKHSIVIDPLYNTIKWSTTKTAITRATRGQRRDSMVVFDCEVSVLSHGRAEHKNGHNSSGKGSKTKLCRSI